MSAHFPRAKYELFTLHHMQMLVWTQRVQTGLSQSAHKAPGPDLINFVQQIAHAARVRGGCASRTAPGGPSPFSAA